MTITRSRVIGVTTTVVSPQPGHQPEASSVRWVASKGPKSAAASSDRSGASVVENVGRAVPAFTLIRVAQWDRKTTGHSDTRVSAACAGSEVIRSSASRSDCSPPPSGYREIHSTFTPSRAWHAVTMVSGNWFGGMSTMKSSTTLPSRFSTISTALMSPPTLPIAVATAPSEPGRSGRVMRIRNTLNIFAHRDYR